MSKVLTMTPTEGESDKEFAVRVAQEVGTFFGESAAEPAAEPAPEPSESAEPELVTAD